MLKWFFLAGVALIVSGFEPNDGYPLLNCRETSSPGDVMYRYPDCRIHGIERIPAVGGQIPSVTAATPVRGTTPATPPSRPPTGNPGPPAGPPSNPPPVHMHDHHHHDQDHERSHDRDRQQHFERNKHDQGERGGRRGGGNR
jgi:hypothetical protein